MAKSYGTRGQTKVTSNIELRIEEIRLKGYTVIEGALNKEELEACQSKLLNIYKDQCIELSAEDLALIGEEGMVRGPLIYDAFFVQLASKEEILEVVERLLGNHFQLHLQNGILVQPNQDHHQTSWHRDLPYQEFIISRPIAISCLICVSEFNSQTGGTMVLDHSHKFENLPSNHYISNNARSIEAQAGSAILFDSMLFHRAGINNSTETRIGLNQVYSIPLLSQQINLPEALEGRHKESPELFRLLGYEYAIPQSVLQYRIMRKDKLKKRS